MVIIAVMDRHSQLLAGVISLVVVLALVWPGTPAQAIGSSSDVPLLVSSMSAAPGFGGLLHRNTTRLQNTLGRLMGFIGRVGIMWLWAVASAAAFLLIVAFSSTADIRLLDFRWRGLRSAPWYIGRGMLTFFGIVWDRHTPALARAVLALALLYWLLPTDIIPDTSVLPGFIDDVIIAVIGAKCFVYLCPDALIASHAGTVDEHVPA